MKFKTPLQWQVKPCTQNGALDPARQYIHENDQTKQEMHLPAEKNVVF